MSKYIIIITYLFFPNFADLLDNIIWVILSMLASSRAKLQKTLIFVSKVGRVTL